MYRFAAAPLLLLLLAASGWAAQPDAAQLQAQGLAVIQSFFSQLKGELKTGMKKGGPVEAIQVCQVQAPAIADRVGAAGGWRVGRTSERLRNPANAPDAWEARVLADFAARARAGAPPSELVFSEVVTNAQGKRVFRLMKGIGVGGMCLVCHGSPSPAVREQLQRLYPADQATGYRPGQLRGAFTLQKALD
ncbi:Tll0287-like domain-containing protein [Desulfoferula mesophila]|uniref:Tll0287-like domain-containing protein n=1 Tax=Desulfoferula mesophila TaxID=3058419 RepID=A0AAU9EHJ6_9BACT|nr:hypothetical protein FAK_36740 [Desulfoferula mesophilus]